MALALEAAGTRPHSGWHRGTSQDGTLGVGHLGSGVGASVRAHGLARGGVRACVRARDSVCYNIHGSLSPALQLLVFTQALDFTLLERLVTPSRTG